MRGDNNSKYCEVDENAVLVNPDDIIIAWDGANAGTSSFGLEGAIGSTLARLSPKGRDFYTPYVGAFVKHNESYLRATCTGATIPHIHRQSLEALVVPLPDISMQRSIAEILNKAQELIDKRKQQIEMLDEFLQSVFLDMFGDPMSPNPKWPTKQLGEVAEVVMGQSPKGSSYNDEGVGTPLLNGPTEFQERYPLEKQWTTQPIRMCKPDDILFCVRGATAGRMNFADKEYCIGRGLAAIRPNDTRQHNLIYMTLRMMYSHFQNTSDGSTFININRNRLTSVLIPMADSDYVSRFFTISEKIQIEKLLLKNSLSKQQNLFDSIMQRAFKGELFG